MSTPSVHDVRELLDREAGLARHHVPPFGDILNAAARRRQKRRVAAVGGGAAAAALIAVLAVSAPVEPTQSGTPISAAAGGPAPVWVPALTCQPNAAANRPPEGPSGLGTNFDVVDSFAQRLTAAEKTRPGSTFGGLHWANPTDGLVIQLGGSGDDEAHRLLTYADHENFPYPISFTRGLTTNERQAIAEDLLTDGIDGHTVESASITGMCHDVEVTLSKPVDATRAHQLSRSASKQHNARVEVGALINVGGAR